ncbi:MAG: hypothetical protein WDN29_08670 [Methylovirgula sp.]
MPDFASDDIGPPFAVFEYDADNWPGYRLIMRFKYASDALAFERDEGKLYVIGYRGRLYRFSEFKKLINAGEII